MPLNYTTPTQKLGLPLLDSGHVSLFLQLYPTLWYLPPQAVQELRQHRFSRHPSCPFPRPSAFIAVALRPALGLGIGFFARRKLKPLAMWIVVQRDGCSGHSRSYQ
jgi:hypothetical protein